MKAYTSYEKIACFLITVVFCCISMPLSARKYYEPNVSFKNLVRHLADERINIDIKKTPEGFKQVDKDSRTWLICNKWSWSRQNKEWIKDGDGIFTVMSYFPFQSDDKQCELCYGTSAYAWIPESSPQWKSPRGTIRYLLMCILDGKSDYRFEDYVTVISGEEARERFNADSIFIFDVPMVYPLQENDGEEYKYCTYVFISKINRSAISAAWFFTEEGAKRKQYYIDKLDKRIWYKD